MKKIISHIGLFSLLTAILIACGPTAIQKEEARVRRSKTPNPISWDTLRLNKTEDLGAKNVKASCTLDINFVVPKEYENPEIVQQIKEELNFAAMGSDDSYRQLSPQEAINRYSSEYIANYKAEAKSQIPLWNKMNGNEVFSYDKNIETEVLYNEANLISYQIRIIENKGNSTSTIVYKNLLLDLTNGTQLHESDIFEEDYKDDLNKIIIEQLLRDNGVETIEALQELGYWGVADLAANNNFYVNKDGITYTFNPDEYADAELGVLKVFINYDDLDDVLKDESPISILVHDLEEQIAGESN